jgi:TPR repeat protein
MFRYILSLVLIINNIIYAQTAIDIQDLDNDNIIDTQDRILRHPFIDKTNGISTNIGEYTLSLKRGWQIASLPVDTILRPDIDDYEFTNDMNEFTDIYVDRYANFKIFGKYHIIWQYTDNKWKAYSQNQIIRDKIIELGHELITQLDKNSAFWILMNENRDVTFYGKEYLYPFDTQNSNGWHLIKYKGSFPNDLKELLGIKHIWEYKDSNWILNPETITNYGVWIYKDSNIDSRMKTTLEARHLIRNEEYSLAIEKLKSIEDFFFAKYNLGLLYLSGQGVEKDYKIAYKYFNDSKEFFWSKYNLAYMIINGLGVNIDHMLAKQYFDEIIQDNNDSYTLYALGTMYANAEAVNQDYEKAKEYYEKSALLGNTTALKSIGNLYINGHGVEKNINKAIEYYIKSAKGNNTTSQNILAIFYFDGECFLQDYTQALKWYRKSAFMGDSADSYRMLAVLYTQGYGITKDYSQAVKYYKKAIEIDPNHFANINLGYMYENGFGVNRDYKKAVELYQLSADNGNKYGQGNLARMYMDGKGVSQDYKKASQYFNLAAEQGLSWAQEYLARLYFDGNGVTQNYDIAYDWYLKAAEQGDTYAMTSIAWYYLDGIGSIKQNKTTAFQWYLKSAANGNTWSQNTMAYLYWHGTGTSINKSKSYCWAKTSCDNGYDTACDIINYDDWSGVYIPNDCQTYLQSEIDEYKIAEEEPEQCTNLDLLFK